MPESTTLGSPRRSALIPASIHAVTIAVVLFFSTSKHSPLAKLIPVRDTALYSPPARVHLHGGGGNGQHSPLPVPKGRPHKAAPRVFTMPVMIARDTSPLLEMPTAVLAGNSFETPAIDLAHIGSPMGSPGPMSGGPMSGGPGGGSGLGDHDGPGAGDKNGPGLGNDGVMAIGSLPRKNATKPELPSKNEPEYTEEARKAKLQGAVVLSVVVTTSGAVADLRTVA